VEAHTYLIRGYGTRSYKYQMEPRTVRKEQAYSKTEYATIQEAAEWAGLNASEWVRHVALLESRKKIAASRFAHKLHERELQR
jgi:hypothetical protein